MGISRRRVELLVAVIIFAVGLAIITDSVHLGIGWSNNSPESGYFPLRVGAILAIASIGIAVQSFLDRSPSASAPFVSWDRFKLVLAIFLPTALYVAGTALIGIYVSSVLFIAAFMLVAGKFHWLMTAVISIGSMAVVFWLFEMEFLVPLPKGPLEAWLGY